MRQELPPDNDTTRAKIETLMRELDSLVEAVPEPEIDMSYFCLDEACGTIACLAGHALLRELPSFTKTGLVLAHCDRNHYRERVPQFGILQRMEALIWAFSPLLTSKEIRGLFSQAGCAETRIRNTEGVRVMLRDRLARVRQAVAERQRTGREVEVPYAPWPRQEKRKHSHEYPQVPGA